MNFRVKANFCNGESPDGANRLHVYRTGESYKGKKVAQLLAEDLIEDVTPSKSDAPADLAPAAPGAEAPEADPTPAPASDAAPEALPAVSEEAAPPPPAKKGKRSR